MSGPTSVSFLPTERPGAAEDQQARARLEPSPGSSGRRGRGKQEGGAKRGFLGAGLLGKRSSASRRHGGGAVQLAAGGGGDFPSGSQVPASCPHPASSAAEAAVVPASPPTPPRPTHRPAVLAGRGTVVVDGRPCLREGEFPPRQRGRPRRSAPRPHGPGEAGRARRVRSPLHPPPPETGAGAPTRIAAGEAEVGAGERRPGRGRGSEASGRGKGVMRTLGDRGDRDEERKGSRRGRA